MHGVCVSVELDGRFSELADDRGSAGTVAGGSAGLGWSLHGIGWSLQQELLHPSRYSLCHWPPAAVLLELREAVGESGCWPEAACLTRSIHGRSLAIVR